MALAAGLHGAVRLSFYRAGKVDQFGVNFRCRIILDNNNDVVRPFRKISGKVIIETRFPIKHKGILIQFEGLCTLRYSSKLDNRTSFHQGRQIILEGTKPEGRDLFQESPILCVIEPKGSYFLNPGTATYPFTLDIPGNLSLPLGFKNALGNLVYRLVVYMKSAGEINTEVGEKILRFNGHLNLYQVPEAAKPIAIEQCYKKSVFCRKKLVEVLFSVESSGFLPGEQIPFIFYVKNVKCFPLELSVNLVQEYKYDASGKRDSPKRRYVIVASKERNEFEPQPETTWIDDLDIREGQEPSFTGHFMYSVTYTIQFKVKILDHGTITGQTRILIGSCRQDDESLMSNASALEVPFVGAPLRRRGSASSTHSARSHNSATTTYSLPPAYSQLSSRIPSIETLPPAYDEVEPFLESQELTWEVPNFSPTSKTRDEGDTTDTPEEEAD